MPDIKPVLEFLSCHTPKAWMTCASEDIPTLLLDHAGLELKAAQQALTLMNRYAGRADLLSKMSRLAREELRHFESVVRILKKKAIVYRPLSASRYFGELHKQIRDTEPNRLVDTLIIGAIIEARSCERFYSLLPFLATSEPDLAALYESLLESEARHFTEYLALAERAADRPIIARCTQLLEIEARLITGPDSHLRFHSGIPG
ncbi:MAG: tRNA-(ms[2]io[6]A)-hydroxylase [Candidatus Rariloculaceae bacterium]